MLNDEARIFGRGVSFPPRLGPDGRWATSAGAENVRESIRVILLTELEERVMLPEFGAGLKRYLFQPNSAPTHRLLAERITQALGRWEPRIAVASVDVEPDEDESRAAVVALRYRLVATGAFEQLRFSVQLGS